MIKVNPLAYYASFVSLALAACSSEGRNTAAADSARAVPVAQVSVLDTVIYNEYVADIQASKNVELRARLSGFLEKIFVEEGAQVKAGQVLFKINDEEYKADVSKAEAVLNNAIADAKTVELEQQRTKTLVKNNIVSKTDLDLAAAKLKAAQSKVAEARSALQYAKSRLSYTLVRAPFSGRIDRIPLKTGSLLTEGSLLTSVSDLSSVNVYFSISEKEYLNIASDSTFAKDKFNKEVKLTLVNGQTYPYAGKAGFAESEFASQTGTISLKAKFPNPNGLLKHGASGKISVPVETGEILAVHQKSVFEIQDRTYVYVVASDNKVKMTPFNAGQRVGHYYTVNSGLSKEDKVVFEGTQSLRDGVQISPKAVALKDAGRLAKK